MRTLSLCMWSILKVTDNTMVWLEGQSLINYQKNSLKEKDDDNGTGRWQEKENEVDNVYKELKEKYGSNFDTSRLRLTIFTRLTIFHGIIKGHLKFQLFQWIHQRRLRQNLYLYSCWRSNNCSSCFFWYINSSMIWKYSKGNNLSFTK